MLIAGSGELRTPLEDAIAAGGLEQHVRLVGQVGDIGSLLCAADVFAFPSRREGTPFAMLEAMSLGLPVVATRFGGADEIIESDVNGVLVPMDDPARLAAALEATLRDPVRAHAIGERARLALGRFSEEEMLTQTLELLARAANGRSVA
jgi:glycosyltransferase involved in cell wall biosynthesis